LNGDKNSRPNSYKPVKRPNYAFSAFGGLKVRHKPAILHNIFFFVLAVSVYLSVIPLFSNHIDADRQHQLETISQVVAADRPIGSNPETSELHLFNLNDQEALRQARISLLRCRHPPQARTDS